MAGFQIEAGGCYGRGFAGEDANGFCANFKEWVVKAYADGGPNWYLHDDFSAVAAADVAAADVTVASNSFYVPAHGFSQGHRVQVTTTGTRPTGISAGTTYFVIIVDADNIQLATDLRNAIGGLGPFTTTAVNITAQGSGTHTIVPYEFFVVVTNTVSPLVNAYNTAPDGLPPKYLKFGYVVNESGWVRTSHWLWWDNALHLGRGVYAGYRLQTYDAADFAYDFRGGEECMCLAARLGTSWSVTFIDTWVGDTNFIEGASSYGVVQVTVPSGSNLVIQLAAGQASNFMVGRKYIYYDFAAGNQVYMVTVTAADAVTDEITLDSSVWDINAGGVIAPYAHRFYVAGDKGFVSGMLDIVNIPISYLSSMTDPAMPYTVAGDSLYNLHHNAWSLYGAYALSFMSIPSIGAPDRYGYYIVQRPSLIEGKTHNGYFARTNPQYFGACKNIYVSSTVGLSQFLDYRTIGGKDYLRVTGVVSSYYCFLFPHTPALS